MFSSPPLRSGVGLNGLGEPELRMRIREIAQSRVRYGYRKIRALLNGEGWNVGKYLVCRLYKEEGLTLKKMRPPSGSGKR
jgi:hypothetical protein